MNGCFFVCVQAAEDEANLNKKRSKKTMQKYLVRQKTAKVDTKIDEQFASGRLYALVASRPGKHGRADGYVLEGKELEFYMKKLK